MVIDVNQGNQTSPEKTPVDIPYKRKNPESCTSKATKYKRVVVADSSSDESQPESPEAKPVPQPQYLPMNHKVTVQRQQATKRYPCGYCPKTKWYAKLQPHLREEHNDREVVKQTINLNRQIERTTDYDQVKKMKEQLKQLHNFLLRNCTYHHNKRVLMKGRGEIVPVRLPVPNLVVNVQDYAFCRHCGGLYRNGRELRRHILEFCPERSNDKDENENAVSESKRLVAIPMSAKVSEHAMTILSRLQEGDVKESIFRDRMLLHITGVLACRVDLGNQNAGNVLRQQLRMFAKLVKLMDVHPPNIEVALQPDNFYKMCAVLRSNFEPSQQQKMGVYLRTAVGLIENFADTNLDSNLQQQMARSFRLHEREFKHLVGHRAMKKSEESKFNKIDLLPVGRDLMKVT